MTTKTYDDMTTDPNRSKLPPENIIWRFPEVHTATGLSRTSIWRHIRDGTFPPPIQLTSRLVGWIASEVLEWRNTRPRITNKG